MNEMNIECPSCGVDVPVTEVLQARIKDDLRREMQEPLNEQRAKLAEREAELKSAEEKLKASNEEFDKRLATAIQDERAKLSKELEDKARESVQLELADKTQELSELKKRVKESEDNELELRRRERELKEKVEKFEVEVERRLDAERTKAKAEALRLADEKHELKVAEKDKTIADMKKKIDELQRKSEQTSQQLKGEVQELALEDRLTNAYPIDSIDPVGKGRNGADVIQTVCDTVGQPVGKIVLESKRTVAWNDKWLAKIREDMRQANADLAVIVTQTMPDGIETIGMMDGVWVCRWDCVIGLVTALRCGLMDVAAAQNAQQGRGTKVEMLYDYFAGNNFRNRVAGMVESIQALQTDLVKEKSATQRRWAKQEKNFDKAIANMAGLYGDFQGIVGEQIPALDNFGPLLLEAGDADDSVASDEADGNKDAA